jgi:peptidylprolyl isomerase
MRGLAILVPCLLLVSCHKAEDEKQVVEARTGSGSGIAPMRARSEQVTPPFDLKTPPADAVKTASGLVYKKMTANDAGSMPKRNDTVMINYTGWHQSTGETFYTNKSRGTPMPLNLSTTAPGFTEAMQLLRKGERAVLWVPASIGYKGAPKGTPETNVYEVEVVDIQAAPAIPQDVAKAPDNAETTAKSQLKFVMVHPGTGKDKAKSYDNVTFNYTGWDADGRMFDTTEMLRKKPATAAPYRQPAPFQEVLTDMTAGERVRFWVDAAKMQGDKPVPGMPSGQLCYEVEILQIEKGIEPPQTPADVAKPPAEAKKTANGVFYKVLKPAAKPGPHPKPEETVRVNYSGWTTDGKMFDSTSTRNKPAEFPLRGVIAGWTDGIPLMSVGDKYRFWIPEQLAYKGEPGKPQGMLVFDVELLEIKPPMGGHDMRPMPHHP